MGVILLPAIVTLAIHLLVFVLEVSGTFQISPGKRFLVAWLTSGFGGIYLGLKTYRESDDLRGFGDMDTKDALGGCVGVFVLMGLVGGVIGQKVTFLKGPVFLMVLYGILIPAQYAIWPPFGKRLAMYAVVARIPEILILFLVSHFSWNQYQPVPAAQFNRSLLLLLPFTFLVGALMGMIATLIGASSMDRKRSERAQAAAVLGALAKKRSTETQDDMGSILGLDAAMASTRDLTSDPKCPNCGTIYNRKAVVRELMHKIAELREMPDWSTRFVCHTCGEGIWVSHRRET